MRLRIVRKNNLAHKDYITEDIENMVNILYFSLAFFQLPTIFS